MFTFHHTNAVSTQINWTAMRQAWDKELSVEHSKLFSDWCTALREIRTMSISRLYFKNGCKFDTTHFHRRVRRSSVYRGTSARRGNVETHLCDRKMPCGTYQTNDDSEVRTSSRSLRSSSQEADFERTWCQNSKKLSLDQFINSLTHQQSAHKKQQVFLANRAAEILENFSMDQWRHVKGIENPANIGTRGMSIEGLKVSGWLNGPAWLKTDEEKWPKPWCQVNEAGAAQVTSSVATETEVDQLFDWRR